MFRNRSYLPIGFGLAAVVLLDWGPAQQDTATRFSWSAAEMATGFLVGTILVAVSRLVGRRTSRR